jgi:hypothetical protein
MSNDPREYTVSTLPLTSSKRNPSYIPEEFMEKMFYFRGYINKTIPISCFSIYKII